MFVDFKLLPDTSRVWVYQADRKFTDIELDEITSQLKSFVANWQRHGENLKASFEIKYKQFIVLGVDENFNDVSGCSIDASVHIIQQLQKQFEVDLLNKMNITFKDGNTINTVSLKQFKEYVQLNKIKPTTVVFNNMITSKADLNTVWEVEASKSWHAKFLN
tara:strand:- start:71256 stop:71741 length:486 start_codon:yes stop_codon:yes gene_type:complete